MSKQAPPRSSRSFTVTFLLALFLGFTGVHRLYLGHFWSACLWGLTLGFLGFGVILDVYMLVTGQMGDAEGALVY